MFNLKMAVVGLVLVGSLSACVQPTPGGNAAVRTVGGAAAGALVADATGGSKTRGALIGAVIGGVSCGVPGLPAC